ncbi:hypothetical protein CVT26_012073, partial [Gymnopilus dilepis]
SSGRVQTPLLPPIQDVILASVSTLDIVALVPRGRCRAPYFTPNHDRLNPSFHRRRRARDLRHRLRSSHTFRVTGSTPHSTSWDVTLLSSSAATSSPEQLTYIHGHLTCCGTAAQRQGCMYGLNLWAFEGREGVHEACRARWEGAMALSGRHYWGFSNCIVTLGNTGIYLSMLLLSLSLRLPRSYMRIFFDVAAQVPGSLMCTPGNA